MISISLVTRFSLIILFTPPCILRIINSKKIAMHTIATMPPKLASSPTTRNIIIAAASCCVMTSLSMVLRSRASHIARIRQDTVNNIIVPRIRRGRLARFHSKHRRFRQRKSWSEFRNDLTDTQFRRYFRMSKEMFRQLCHQIIDVIGEEEFKSEDFINEKINSVRFGSQDNIFVAHAQSTGGIISGEVKVALTLRILGGGTYLDMALIFASSFNHAHKIFKYVVTNWICHPNFCPINGIEYCNNDVLMKKVSDEYAESTNNVMNGCIGALDGWIVKIKCPSQRDNVQNPHSFYSRKGFYGLNVQAIVDKRKRIWFRSIISRGAEHDSTAFKNSSLYKWLLDNWTRLARKGFYFVGDSAYSIRSFLLTPYDNALHGTPEDNYNFFHSSARISVECAFGEIDLRWGIFWSPLKFSLHFNCLIIDACMRLHNFIVSWVKRHCAVRICPRLSNPFN